MPFASNLSETSTTRSYKSSGRLIFKSNSNGLFWYPILNKSPKPLVINKSVLSPFLSRRAFVATVVPIFTDDILSTGILSSFFKFRIFLIPAIAASL